MPLRAFSSVPRYAATLAITLPNVNAGATAELGLTPAQFNTGAFGGGITNDAMVLAHPTEAQAVGTATGVAFPAALSFSHAYFKNSDGKLYFRFTNPTGSNYTAADIVAFHVMAF